jgi:hypothetical protein
MQNSMGPLLCFHGCEADVADAIFSGKQGLNASTNDYDWLGKGIYFWVGSAERAWHWAAVRKKGKIKKPAVVGAVVYAGHCLNLTDFGVVDEISKAYESLRNIHKTAELALPANSEEIAGTEYNRRLDCAVIEHVHKLRRDSKPAAMEYDSVYGVFEEGKPIFPGAAMRKYNHIQIAVRNTDCIAGYFRPALKK